MGNTSLNKAKREKNDEFYTQMSDIEQEIVAYLEYDPDMFRGKTVLLPCDDPSWSNFTLFFTLWFRKLGLKKLISTSYAPAMNHGGLFYTPSPDSAKDPRFSPELDGVWGKIFVLEEKDVPESGVPRPEDIRWEYLSGSGDFRSSEVTALRDSADFVITNPPFSLFRDFIDWLNDGDVKYSVIGNANAVTYKNVFPLIRDNKLWLGAFGFRSITYRVPDAQLCPGESPFRSMGNTCWFSNIEHGRRGKLLRLLTLAENRVSNKQIMKDERSYCSYDDYDAIEVPYMSGIPSDYPGVMGVPISFLDKYCPEQFEILNTDAPSVNGRNVYKRIFIKHLSDEKNLSEKL